MLPVLSIDEGGAKFSEIKLHLNATSIDIYLIYFVSRFTFTLLIFMINCYDKLCLLIEMH